MTQYLFDIVILLIAAVSVVSFFQKMGLGGVPGYLIAGVIVGPAGFALIHNPEEISHFAEFGVVLLLFLIGIELKPSRLWLMRKQVFGLGSLQIIVSSILIGAIAHLLFQVELHAAILIGPALALSSTAFVLQLLTENKLLQSHYGRTSFAVLLMQDVAVVPLLAMVPLLSASQININSSIIFDLLLVIGVLAILVTAGRALLHPLLHRVAKAGNSDTFTATALLIVLGISLATEHAGLSMAMGAFIAGLLISDSSYRHQVSAEIHPFRGLLLGLFFMSMGMSINLELLFQKPFISFGIVILLLSLKILVLYPLCRLFTNSKENSLATALTLSQSGEFALILFALANQQDLINDALFQQMLLTVLLSMLATPPLAILAKRLVSQQKNSTPDDDIHKTAPIVLAGFGRVGHRIGDILNKLGQDYVALDRDPDLVDQQRKLGYPVFYGDVCKPEVLKHAGAEHANTIIITINEMEACEHLVVSLRQKYPDKKIFARGHSLANSQNLCHLGANGVVSENVEASIELARMAMENENLPSDALDDALVEFRNNYQNQILIKAPKL